MKKKSKFTQLTTGAALISAVGNLGTSALVTETKKSADVPELRSATNFKDRKLTSNSKKLGDLLRPGYREIVVQMKDIYGNYVGEKVIHVSDNNNTEVKNKIDNDNSQDYTEMNTSENEEETKILPEELENLKTEKDIEKSNENIKKDENPQTSIEQNSIGTEESEDSILKDPIKQSISEIAQGTFEGAPTEQRLISEESSNGSFSEHIAQSIKSQMSGMAIKFIAKGGVPGLAKEGTDWFTGGGKTKSEKIGGFVGRILGTFFIPSLLCTALASIGSTSVFLIPAMASAGIYALLSKFEVGEKITKIGKTVGGCIGNGLSKLFKSQSKSKKQVKSKGKGNKPKSQSKNKNKNVGAKTSKGEGPDIAQLGAVMNFLMENKDKIPNEEQLKNMLGELQSNENLKMFGNKTLRNISNNSQINFSKLPKQFVEEDTKKGSTDSSSNPNSENATPTKKTWTQKICGFCLPALLYGALTAGYYKFLGVPAITSALAAYGTIPFVTSIIFVGGTTVAVAAAMTGLAVYGTYSGAKCVFSKVKGLFTKKSPEKVENNANKSQNPLLNQIPKI